MKLLISFSTYPRNNRVTFNSLQDTFSSLIKNDKINIDIEFIVVGDDYPNIDELSSIFNGYKVSFFNINQNTALRKEKISKEIIWSQAVQPSKIFILEYALKTDYDYLLMSFLLHFFLAILHGFYNLELLLKLYPKIAWSDSNVLNELIHEQLNNLKQIEEP